MFQSEKIRIEDILLFLLFFVYPLDWFFAIGAGSTMQESQGITLMHFFSALLIITCTWKILLQKNAEILRIPFSTPVTFLIILNIGVMLLSAVISRDPGPALGNTMQRITLFVLYIFIVYLAKDRRILRIMIIAFVSSSILSIVAGGYEMITQDYVVEELNYSATKKRVVLTEASGAFRVRGLNPESDAHAAQMLMQLGMLLYLIFWVRTTKARLIGIAIMLLMQVNIIATASRAAWLGLVIVMGAFLVLAPLPRKRLIIASTLGLSFLAIIVMLLLFPNLAVMNRLLGKSQEGNIAFSFRSDMIAISYDIGRRNPWLGVGSGNFREAYLNVVSDTPSLTRHVIPFPHNIYMASFAENGIIGLALYLALHFAVLWQLYHYIRSSPDIDAKIMGVGLFVSFLLFMHCLNFYSLAGSKYGWTVMALAGAFAKVMKNERATNNPALTAMDG